MVKSTRKTRKKRASLHGGNRAPITIYLMCYNEEVLIPHTVAYYKEQFPGVEITIVDNQSTDRSVEIAKELGCTIQTWDTDGKYDDFRLTEMKNTVWKTAKTEWVLVCDMDEYLVASTKDLVKEKGRGTTILKTEAYEAVGESNQENISDIQITNISKGFRLPTYDKSICFRPSKITDINFELGCHTAVPQGEVKYSKKAYLLYHYKFLGIPYRNRQRSVTGRHKSKGMINAGKPGVPGEFESDALSQDYKKKLGESVKIRSIKDLTHLRK